MLKSTLYSGNALKLSPQEITVTGDLLFLIGHQLFLIKTNHSDGHKIFDVVPGRCVRLPIELIYASAENIIGPRL